MGFVEKKDVDNCGADSEVEDSDEVVCISKNMSTTSLCVTEDDDEEVQGEIQIGPRRTLKEQYEADKDDESLMRWKAQLLGAVDINSVAETLDPEVKILSLAIVSPGREDLLLPIPDSGKVKGTWFTLKEGSRYAIKFTFQVGNNIVSGLKYTNTVWKTGLKVDKTKEMIGTFSPQQELYTHEIPEDTTPSGILARGSYSAKTKFLDDDNKCYLELNYTFDIRKDWQSS
ncbi:putative Rho protein GDP-dissociation inhibitor [Helianthus annuus]|uniref:Putative immunoglobulin E-set superfamily protein n=1 Tax=Helianthus annuus TaxID=4232 RepID=A0A251RS37_HELAN|nr:rho GDP-dissociation inhibitor 1 [Helianthus annuus]KAF5756342.1 putative Rho protein GDP-dissociation inhibitor [Helianthus annuus]